MQPSSAVDEGAARATAPQDALRPITPRSSRTVPALQGTETVLVVDDDAVMRKAIRNALVWNGYTVLEAGSAFEAVMQWASRRSPIDLVLLDVSLPADGAPAVHTILQREPDGPAVIYLMDEGGDEVQARQSVGSRGVVLRKPFQHEQLLLMTRAVLEQSLARV